MQKPEMYSTALSTRDARAIVNIAAPFPEGLKIIDPCCGIGTVLVEAMSMGIAIEGRDVNKRVVWGSRINLRHFGFEGDSSWRLDVVVDIVCSISGFGGFCASTSCCKGERVS